MDAYKFIDRGWLQSHQLLPIQIKLNSNHSPKKNLTMQHNFHLYYNSEKEIEKERGGITKLKEEKRNNLVKKSTHKKKDNL